jgi:Mg/Co/Ni transporter MgtE
MNPEVSTPNTLDRETQLETLVMLAELGQEDQVRTGIATLHPADVAALLDAIEEEEIKQKLFNFLPPDLASEVLSFVSPLTQEELTQELPDAVSRSRRAT